MSHLLVVLPLRLEHGLHLLPLPLGPDVVADPLLEELQAPLVLGDLEQLHGAALVRGVAGHLADHVAHELVVVGVLALVLAGALLEGVGGRLVALVQAHADLVAGSHRDWGIKLPDSGK